MTILSALAQSHISHGMNRRVEILPIQWICRYEWICASNAYPYFSNKEQDFTCAQHLLAINTSPDSIHIDDELLYR